MSTAPIISVYDGQRLLGHITERARGYIARTWPEEVLLALSRPARKEPEPDDPRTKITLDRTAVACRDDPTTKQHPPRRSPRQPRSCSRTRSMYRSRRWLGEA